MLGWLGIATALAFDQNHTAYGEALAGAVSESGVDYGVLASHEAKLEAFLADVKTADLASMSNAQKLALYVDTYNAFTLLTVLNAGPPSSIQNIDGGKVWDTEKVSVGGTDMTLNQLETAARKLTDGRIHAGVNCASKGCPPLGLKPFLATTLEAQLDEQARRWVKTNAFAIDGTTIHLSHIFEWYAADFTKENKGDLAGVDGPAENALWFLSRFADDATKQKLQSGTLTADWMNYDWSLNKK